MTILTRRRLLFGLGLLPLAACSPEPTDLRGALGLEPKLPRRRFRTLVVDVSPIRRAGVPAWADRVGAAVRRAAAPAFADMIDPHDRRAPALVLEIDGCDFPVYVGDRWRRGPFGSFGADDTTDWIEGHVVFAGTRRRVAVTRSVAQAGPWYAADVDQRRLDGVADAFAAWARREFEP